MSSRWTERVRYALPFRLALWYGVLFVASAVAMVGLTYMLLARSLEASDHQVIRSTLARYATEYQAGGIAGLDRAINVDRLAGRYERLFVRVVGRSSEVIFFNIPVRWQDFDLSALDGAASTAGGSWTTLPDRIGDTVLDVASARLSDGTLFQVGRSSDARDELLRLFRSRVLIVMASILTIAAVGGAILTWIGLAPVRGLATTVGAIIRTGELTKRVSVRQTGDSLDELGGLVNGMLDRIQTLISGMHAALDNVAHDLRTPLTRLRGVAEAALASEDPGAARQGLERVLEETERITAALTALMDISEAEVGAMRLNRERVRLADLAREACDLYADVAEDKGVDLRSLVPEGLHVTVDRVRLRQVIANLLDNAVKYTPQGGRVDVEAEARPGGVELRVRDTGIGVPEADQPRVWDRLFRGDASRGERGLGLGLSLVKAIVVAHGGSVAVQSTPGAGSVFSIVLPDAGTGGPAA